MAKLEIPIEVKFDDFKAVIEEIKNLQTYKLSEDDDMVLVDLDKVADILSSHIEVKRNDAPQKTNADRIRAMSDAMSDDELAKFITSGYYQPHCPVESCPVVEDCEECWLDWLKKEVEE